MRSIKSKDTNAEMVVRRLVHSLGYRYRLHCDDLPGKPDLVFRSRKKLIFVNGCFWHGHECKRGARVPKTNTDYWVGKVQKNSNRDKKNIQLLKNLGWNVLIVWECEIKDADSLAQKIKKFMGESTETKKTRSLSL